MKVIKAISLFFAALAAFFQPIPVQHGNGMCCAECAFAFKKEEEIEIVDEKEENTEA